MHCLAAFLPTGGSAKCSSRGAERRVRSVRATVPAAALLAGYSLAGASGRVGFAADPRS
jgi:hypothetical protein